MRLCLGLSVSTQQVGLLTRYRDRKAYTYTHAHPLHTSHNTQPSFPLNPVRSPPSSLSFLTFSTNLKVSFFEQTNKLSLSLLVCGVTIQLSLFVGLQERREEGKGSKSSSQTFLLSLAFFQAFLCEMGTDLAWNPIPALLHSHKATLSSPWSCLEGMEKGGDGLLRWLWRVGSLLFLSFLFSFFIWISFVIGFLFLCWETEKEDGCPL